MNSNHHLLDIITTDSNGGGGAADASGRMVSNSSSASFPTPNRHAIIGTNDVGVGHGGGGGTSGMLSPHPHPPRSSFQLNTGSDNQNQHLGGRSLAAEFLGLNLGRSHTAAPETWEYGKQHLPSSTKSATALSSSNAESENGIFGSSNQQQQQQQQHFNHRDFFDDDYDDDDREAFMRLGTRRPASTGVIGRQNNGAYHDNSGDVNSILETLGITSLEPSPDKNQHHHIRSITNGISVGGLDVSSDSFVKGAHIPSNRSLIMEKIIHERDRDPSEVPTHLQSGEGDLSSSNVFSFQGGGSSQIDLQYGAGNHHQQQHRMHQGSSQVHTNQYVLQEQSLPRHQDSSPYNFQQQQINYHHQQQASPQAYHSTDYRSKYPANVNAMQSNVLQMNAGQQHSHHQHQQQQTVYHITSPTAAPYSLEYQTSQQQQQQQQQHGSMPTNHILLPHQHISGSTAPMHGQPQYISIVPIQAVAAHSIGGGGQPTYAYVQYGDGTMAVTSPPNLVAGGGGGGIPATTFVMSPNGPIAVSSTTPSGAVPVNVFNFSGHHGTSSSAGSSGLRSPTRLAVGGGNTLKSPDRSILCQGKNTKKNILSSPRGGKRVDKNATIPSKLGPEASYLLNEIRGAKSRNMWTIHDIRGHVVEFCNDQNGSRFIQQRLEVADVDEKNAVMEEVIPAMKELQNDVFGNYVIQKLFEFGTDSMKKELKGALTGNMVLLSLQMHGCRVIQKALESLDYDDLTDLLQELDSCVLTCIQDQNGNHVMQKIIEVMSTKANEVEGMTGDKKLSNSMAMRMQFIVNDVLANVRTLCCHPYGCRVLQRMLEHCVEFQKAATLDEIRHCHKALLDDQYGNYVIQHVLQYGRESDRDSLLNIVVNNDLLKLSRQKFASNVVEKLLKYGNSNQRNAIVREMLKVVNESGGNQEGVGSSVLLLMVRDAYANYVVQTAIDVVPEGNEKRMMLDELKNHEVQLRNYTFAKHIVAKLPVA